ncbi:MAG TPA: hypothetical protein PKA27_15790 [Fimbriimonadaceae bacterium]|nr:hypothetical protein [Fimbriimonadaceae bacterium]
MNTQLCACICVHDDTEHLSRTLGALGNLAIVLVVSRVDWKGATGDGWKEAVRIGESHGAQVVLGDWSPEEPHRLAAYEKLQELGYTHAIIPDGDEVIEPALLETLKRIAEQDLADRVYVEWDTYWSDIAHVVRPREPFTPCMMIKLGSARYRRVREFDGGRSLFLNETYGIVHHLSYVGPDERIAKKITTWGHKD